MIGLRRLLTRLTLAAPIAHEPARAPAVIARYRRMTARRARASLLWLLGIMFVSHAVFWVALEFWLPELRDPEYGRRLRFVQQSVADRTGRPLVLVLGSSRIVMGLRPDVLPDGPADPIVFNAARVGGGPLMQQVLLRRYLDAGVRPAAVVVEVWPQLFNGRELDRIEPGRLWLREVARLGSRSDVGRWCESLAATFAPWADHRVEFMQHILPGWSANADRVRLQTVGWTWLGLDRWGWLPMLRNPELERIPRVQLIQRMRDVYEPPLRDLDLDSQVEADYHALLRLCRERAIPAVLLYMPESSEFRGFYGPGTWERFRGVVARLRLESGAELIDGRLVVDDAGLPDGHHLSPVGAAVFTRWFGREGLGPWLRQHVSP